MDLVPLVAKMQNLLPANKISHNEHSCMIAYIFNCRFREEFKSRWREIGYI